MIVCDFFKFMDELMSSSMPCSEFDAYPVRLSDSILDNFVEFSTYCSSYDFSSDSDSYVLMRDFLEAIYKRGQRICYSFIVLDRRFGLGSSYSCLYGSFYVRCIAFEHCNFSLVIMTTIPRKK